MTDVEKKLKNVQKIQHRAQFAGFAPSGRPIQIYDSPGLYDRMQDGGSEDQDHRVHR